MPAMVTYKAKGVVPDDDPWFAGVFTNGAIERPLIDESDLLIGIGLDPVELLPRPWPFSQPDRVRRASGAVATAMCPFGAQIVSDIPIGASARLDSLLPASNWDRGRVRRAADEQRQRVRVRAAGLTAQRRRRAAQPRLAASDRVTVDAGAHMFPATMLWPVQRAERHADLERPVDDGLRAAGGDRRGAARSRSAGGRADRRRRPADVRGGAADGGARALRIITIVFNDASLSLIEIKQQARAAAAGGRGARRGGLGGARRRVLACRPGPRRRRRARARALGRQADRSIVRPER